MGRQRFLVALVLVASLGVALTTAPALAQDGPDRGDRSGGTADAGGTETAETEGGIEGILAGFIEERGLVGTVLVLLAGMALLTVSVNRLIGYLTRAALGLRVSLFALGILFTGFEFDDTVLALVLSAGDLEGVALGTALGTGLAVVGLTLALAAVAFPFRVDIPTDYLAILALAPVVLVPFAVVGSLTLVHGLVLLLVFVLAFGYIVVQEFRRDSPIFRGAELHDAIRTDGGVDRSPSITPIVEDRVVRGRAAAGWVWLGLAVLALVGVVFASMLLEAGSEAAVEATGVQGTVFGATVLTAILTFEDIMLTVEPVRRGVPEIGIANVIGSVLFSLTGNVGVIMLVSDLSISSAVLWLHLPTVIVVTGLAAYFLATGHVKRWHGLLLGGLYAAYWTVALVAFGGVPLGG